jgi:ribosomal protein L16 Arg81 hydroxylase
MSFPDMSREQALALLQRKREAVETLTNGLREFLMADLDTDFEVIESEPLPDREAIVSRLTENLMAATSQVQMVEAQVQQVQEMLNSLDPGTLAILKPFEPMINGIVLPMFQRMWQKAARERDEIQAELMEYETPEATT